jgi:hypothetical protein
MDNQTYMFKKNFISSLAGVLVVGGIIFSATFAQIELAFAAALTTLSDTQSSLKISTLSDHTIQFVTNTAISAGEGISVTFPAGYATGTFAVANFDLATSTSATCSGFADALLASGAASGLTWGVTQATSSIYITSGTAVIPANRCVQIRIGSNAISQASGTSQITNPSAANTYIISIAAGVDTGSVTENIITDDTVAMTGLVNQSLTFTISTTTIYFGTLSSTGAKYASSTNSAGDIAETIAHTLAVGTNAPSGFTLTVRGQTLTSQQNASNTITAIGASAASSTLTGTEQFGIRVTEAGGSGTAVSSPYGFSTSYGYAGTATSSSIIATGSGSTPTSTYSVRYVSNIAAVTEAGTYAANLVYVATANF